MKQYTASTATYYMPSGLNDLLKDTHNANKQQSATTTWAIPLYSDPYTDTLTSIPSAHSSKREANCRATNSYLRPDLNLQIRILPVFTHREQFPQPYMDEYRHTICP